MKTFDIQFCEDQLQTLHRILSSVELDLESELIADMIEYVLESDDTETLHRFCF